MKEKKKKKKKKKKNFFDKSCPFITLWKEEQFLIYNYLPVSNVEMGYPEHVSS